MTDSSALLKKISDLGAEKSGTYASADFWRHFGHHLEDLAKLLDLGCLKLYAASPGLEHGDLHLDLLGVCAGAKGAKSARAQAGPAAFDLGGPVVENLRRGSALGLTEGLVESLSAVGSERSCIITNDQAESVIVLASQGSAVCAGLMTPLTNPTQGDIVTGLLQINFGGNLAAVDALALSAQIDVVAMLLARHLEPSSAYKKGGDSVAGASGSAGYSVSAATVDLSRRLAMEQFMRQTITKMHATLDRDFLLQSLVDSLGRAFRPTRCLVLKSGQGLSTMVSHEYEEPDLSPLGLGRTVQFPAFASELFKTRCTGYGDVGALLGSGEISEKQFKELSEASIVSLAGSPLTCEGEHFGVVVLLDNKRRPWTKDDLDCLELLSGQASIALSHSAFCQEMKDQLFHLSLMSNLTEQLTSALETVSRLPRGGPGGGPVPSREERMQSAEPSDTAALSHREMEVLKLIASGYANKEIAQRLFLTESTVELHASRIRKKLKLKSRTALVKYACDNGFV